MAILNKSDKTQVDQYNEFVRNFDSASAMQDLNWAKVKTSWKQEAVYIKQEDKIIAAMTILLEKVPGFNSYLMYAPRGPVCDVNNISLVKKLVEESDIIAKKYNAFLLKFDPEIKYDQKLENLYKSNGFKVLGKNAGVDQLIQPRYNMVLNIKNKDQDQIFKDFSEKTRYNIRLSKRKGVTVRYSRDIEDLRAFYKLYEITTARDKIGRRSYDYFYNLLHAYDDKHLRIYIASYNTEDLSAAIALNYGGKMFYIYGASSNQKRNYMPNYLMQWEMIKWAVESKCSNYDFGGVLILNEQNGLYRFKIGFCRKDGLIELLGEIDKVYKPFIYFLYSKCLPIFKKVRRFFRKNNK